MSAYMRSYVRKRVGYRMHAHLWGLAACARPPACMGGGVCVGVGGWTLVGTAHVIAYQSSCGAVFACSWFNVFLYLRTRCMR